MVIIQKVKGGKDKKRGHINVWNARKSSGAGRKHLRCSHRLKGRKMQKLRPNPAYNMLLLLLYIILDAVPQLLSHPDDDTDQWSLVRAHVAGFYGAAAEELLEEQLVFYVFNSGLNK